MSIHTFKSYNKFSKLIYYPDTKKTIISISMPDNGDKDLILELINSTVKNKFKFLTNSIKCKILFDAGQYSLVEDIENNREVISHISI